MDPAASQRVLKFGSYLVDLRAGELRKFGSRVRLQEKPLQLLAALAERSGQVVTREELHRRLWPDHTFVDFETGLNTAVSKLRDALSDRSEKPRYIETIPRRGYRFIFPVEMGNGHSPADEEGKPKLALQAVATTVVELESAGSAEAMARTTGRNRSTSRTGLWSLLGVILLLCLLAGGYLYSHRAHKLTDRDTIVVADFANSTGDPIFDDTLKTGLTVSLRQSPFLNVLPDSEVGKTLQLMTRPTDTKLTPTVAAELCQRANSKAYVAGSISSIGNEYVLGLKAVNCQSGDLLAQEQVTASSKEKVLDNLGETTSKLRGEMGESLVTVVKFSLPLERATTASLEALKAYSLGIEGLHTSGTAAAVPFFQRAIELDPNFASAYLYLGKMYVNSDQQNRAAKLFTKAFFLRDHASEREKFDIESMYNEDVTGDMESTVNVFHEWLGSYPRDYTALGNLAIAYSEEGQLEQAVELERESDQMERNDVIRYQNLAFDLMNLNRFLEARTTLQHAVDLHRDDEISHELLYILAFLDGDARGMTEEVGWSEGRPQSVADFISYESSVEAYFGHLQKSRELNRRAIEAAVRVGLPESAEYWRLRAALREAAFGNVQKARQTALEALGDSVLKQGPGGIGALALAQAGDSSSAEKVLDGLASRYPKDTLVRSVVLPTVRAQIDIAEGHPDRGIEILQASEPYELTVASLGSCIYPAYVRGEAYLATKEGAAAATEFQKVIDHRGLVEACETGILSRLGLARANALESRTLNGADAESARARALANYKDFLTLWKDADPDIPILKQAKAEYAKMLNVSESSK
jgi:DNA-binding winged helix-turn-helix (wHTH) protein/tetratricopeptide (TPR) repeat protein